MAETNYKVISTSALIEKFQYALDNGWGYIWGTAGEKWTVEKQAKLNQTTDSDRKMGREYGKKWIGHYVADCSGLFSWAFKKLGSYMYHGSNTMWNKYCTAKGELRNGKRTDGQELKPGTAVFTYNEKKNNRGHVGLYIGNGWVIEAEGTKAGVRRSKITNSKWVEWGELKRVDYGNGSSVGQVVSDTVEEPKPNTGLSTSVATYPTIRKNARGDLVVQLQRILDKNGFSLSIDGIFGPKTEEAVKAFQRKFHLVVDGIVGPNTWNALLKVK